MRQVNQHIPMEGGNKEHKLRNTDMKCMSLASKARYNQDGAHECNGIKIFVRNQIFQLKPLSKYGRGD